MNKEIEQKPNIFFFTGENLVELNRVLNHWVNEFKKKHQEINLEKYSSMTQEDLGAIIMALQSAPFLSSKRMVVVKGIPSSSADKIKLEMESFIEALPQISPENILIIVSPNPDKRGKLYKTLLKVAKVKEFTILKGQPLTQWVFAEVKSRRGNISLFTAKEMISYCGENMINLSHEIDKLILYKKNEEIVQDDIFLVCIMNPLSNIFAFTGGIGGRDKRQNLLMLQKLINSGESIQLIFFMIVRQFRYLIQVRYLLDHHKSKGEIQSQLKLAPFQVSQYINQSRNWNYIKLKEIYSELLEMDIKVKVGKIPSSTDTQKIFQLCIEKFLLCTTLAQ